MVHLRYRDEINHRAFWMMTQENPNDGQSFFHFPILLSYFLSPTVSPLIWNSVSGLGSCIGSKEERECCFSATFCSCRHLIQANKWLLRLSRCSCRENRSDRDAGWKWKFLCEGARERERETESFEKGVWNLSITSVHIFGNIWIFDNCWCALFSYLVLQLLHKKGLENIKFYLILIQLWP